MGIALFECSAAVLEVKSLRLNPRPVGGAWVRSPLTHVYVRGGRDGPADGHGSGHTTWLACQHGLIMATRHGLPAHPMRGKVPSPAKTPVELNGIMTPNKGYIKFVDSSIISFCTLRIFHSMHAVGQLAWPAVCT